MNINIYKISLGTVELKKRHSTYHVHTTTALTMRIQVRLFIYFRLEPRSVRL